MMPKIPISRGLRACSLPALLALLCTSSHATVYTWNPTVTGNWSSTASWTGGTVPTSDATNELVFQNTGTTYTSTYDILGNFTLNKLTFSGSGTASLTLGAANGTGYLVFAANSGTNPTIVFDSFGTRTIGWAMRLDADTTVTSTITNAAGNLQLGALNGTGSLIVNYTTSGSGVVLLANNNSAWTGGVALQNGRVVVTNTNALGTGTLTLSGGLLRTSNSSGTLSFSNILNIAGSTSFFDSTNTNGLTFTNGGAIQGTSATHTITLGNAAATLTLGGAFTGNGNGLTFAGSGIVNLGSGSSDTAANTYSGATTLASSTTTLNLNKAAGTNAVAGNLVVSASRVNWLNANQVADTSTVTVTGGTVDFAATSTGNGVNETIGALSLSSGALSTNPSGAATGNTINVTGATTLTGGTFTVNKGSTLNTGSLSLTTAATGARYVGGNLTVGSGGLVITRDDTTATRNALTLYESATTSAGVLTLGGDLTFNVSTNSAYTGMVQITRSSGMGYIDLAGGNRTFTINDGGADNDLQISVALTNGGLIKEGSGVLSFINTTSTYSGDTVINHGTLRTSSSGQLLSTSSTYRLADNAGATLDLAGNSQSVGAIAGGGSTGGNITLGTGTLTTGLNGTINTFSGDISGTGGLTKTGTGTLTLSGAKSYTGATLISGGGLVINGTLASSSVTLNGASATLGGSGTVNDLTITAGTFGPGNSAGTFTANGTVSFGADAVYAVEFSSSSLYDQLVVNGSSSTISINAASTLSLSGLSSLSALADGTTFVLIDNNTSNSIIGSFASYTEGASFTIGANTFIVSYLLNGSDFGLTVSAASVPEVSTAAFLLGFGALAFAARRRRS